MFTMPAEITVPIFERSPSKLTKEKGATAQNNWKRAKEYLMIKQVDVQDIKDSMEQMKDWILHKCKTPISGALNPTGNRANLQNVVTPDSIPQFMIPGQVENARNSKENVRSSSEITTPATQYVSSPNILQVNSVHCRSAPVSPSGPLSKQNTDFNCSESFDCIRELQHTTNADPHSVLATSLPHFRTQTSYGLTTVSQNPHTRRKESLFHVLQNNESTENASRRSSQLRKKFASLDEAQVLKVNTTPTTPVFEIRNKSRKSTSSLPRRRQHVNYVAAPLGVVGSSSSLDAHSASDSPHMSSPSTPELAVRSAARAQGSRPNYYRRRSSLALARTPAECIVCNKSTSTSDDSSDENCRTTDLARSKVYRRRSSLVGAEQNGPICHTCILSRLQARLMAELGELKLSVEYIEKQKQLKVLLIRAENLGGRMRPEENISTFAKVCLMPGKQQRRVSKVVKHTSDPIFDEVMYFNDIEKDSIKEITLRVKILHKTHNLKSERLIGQVLVELGSFNLAKEVRVWKNLQPKAETEDLGKLDVTVRFEPKEERLYATVNNARRLRSHAVTGPPDAYAKVTVRQPGRSHLKKSTAIRKNAINPSFGETFIFPISPKIEDLKYAAVTLTIYDHTKLRSDVPIGQVRLGHGSTEECEFEHWNQVLQHPGQDYTWLHTLMDPSEVK